MKKTLKLTYLLSVALLLTLFNCNDDDGVEITIEDLTVTIDENPTNGQIIGTVEVMGTSSPTLSIDTQTPNGALSIDAATGELTVADAILFDFETNPTITATISATGASNTASITINLNDINELTANDFSATIDENPTNGDVLGTVQAMGDAIVSFSIASQTPANALNIDATSGELTVADATLFDFETNPTITATITVDNSGNMSNITAVITISNVGELSPQDFNASIDENPTTGDIIGTVLAPGFGTTTFSLTTQTPANALTINTTTGELTVADASLFDFETNPTITADILVENSGETATLSATITLNDIIVTIFTFDESIDENPSNGDVIGTVMSDATGNPNYSIVSQTPAGAINIDPDTGVVTVADASLFDHETNLQVDAVVAADEAVDSSDFELQIDNINEIGDFAHGGVIFWIDPTSNNSEGLVVDVNDIVSPNAPQGITWRVGADIVVGASGTAIGTGEANTTAIVANYLSGDYAAWLCAAYQLDGYTDWYLPSRAALEEIYANRVLIDATSLANGGTAFPTALSSFYWSSTEFNDIVAFAVDFGNGATAGPLKSTDYSVRAVRAWTDF